ncbi:hypothetical protein GOV13_03660 [Candidatus Pacearchaeota archaeon]|nr:hypothetical protein [Candidatus Pacearchaeota archaeon]
MVDNVLNRMYLGLPIKMQNCISNNRLSPIQILSQRIAPLFGGPIPTRYTYDDFEEVRDQCSLFSEEIEIVKIKCSDYLIMAMGLG